MHCFTKKEKNRIKGLVFSTRLYKGSFYQVSSFERFSQLTSSQKPLWKCSALEDKPLCASAQSHTSCTQIFSSFYLSQTQLDLKCTSVGDLVSSRVLILKCLSMSYHPSTSLHFKEVLHFLLHSYFSAYKIYVFYKI